MRVREVSMHHFFVDQNAIKDGKVTICGLDVNHIKNVLRIKQGEELRISDGTGRDYICSLLSYEDEKAVLNIVCESEERTEPASKFYLFQGLPKADKMELIIQKAVELGVYEIVPVSTSRCVVKLDDKKKESKIKRWQAISESAAKQSKRGIIPKVHDVLSYKEALTYAKELTGVDGTVLIPYENYKDMKETKEVLDKAAKTANICVFIGPEGGFSESEVDLSLDYDAKRISLGKRILRTETAGLAILSILMYLTEE